MSECVECGHEMGAGSSVCTSRGVQKLILVVNETVNVSEPPIAGRLLGKLRRGLSGRRRPAREMRFGPARWRGTDRLVTKSVLVDRDADLYHERIADAETGEVLHEDRGKLRDHRGHGSAKARGPRGHRL